MKLKNIKNYSTTLLLATTLGLTGCSSTSTTKETTLEDYEQSFIEDEQLKQEISITTKTDESKEAIDKINRHFNYSIVLHYYSSTGIITINGPYENKLIPELTNELYEKLNSILEQSTIQTLEIRNLGNEIDFSRLNLSNVKNLTLDGCKAEFNYEPFKNQKYENISLEEISSESAKEIIKNTTTLDTNIDYVNYNSSEETSDFIKFISKNQIPSHDLHIATTELTTEDYVSLSKANIANIDINFTAPSNQTYNLELYLNPNINGFHIWHAGNNIELGNIQIISDVPFFHFSFNGYQSIITENTSFNLPDYSTVSISAKYESGNALQNLSNTYAFDFYDYNTKKVISYNCEADNLEEIMNEYTNTYQIKKELQ